MGDIPVRFNDGASYDLMMGPWSRSAGAIFLDWIKAGPGLDWLDVGCGSGAFTSLIVERCSPHTVVAVDPSQAQLEFARSRGLGDRVQLIAGDAMKLPLEDRSVDVAAAALVVHFMPDPARGVAEMARVVRDGGIVAAYAWDLTAGGFPYEAVHAGLRSIGLPPIEPPHPEAAESPELRRLWAAAGLTSIAQRVVVVTRSFGDFEEYWQSATASPRIAAVLRGIPADRLTELKDSVAGSMRPGADGSISPTATANAIIGRVPR